jgi:hypothetical protein
MTATELLDDLTRQGFTLTPQGGSIRVRPASRLTEAQRQAVAGHKLTILALLTAPVAPSAPWNAVEAGRQVGAALAAWRWPAERAARCRLGELADAVDAAYLARDLPRLRQAVAASLAFGSSPDGATAR